MTIPRIIVLGDSNAGGPYEDGDATDNWVYQLQGLTKRVVINLSAHGNRISSGASPNASVYANMQSLNFTRGVVGYADDILIVQAVTNDFPASDIRIYTTTPTETRCLHMDYRSILAYGQSNGMKMLCISPLWRGDEATAYPHPDGSWPLGSYRDWVAAFAAQYGAAFLPHNSMGLVPSDFAADHLHLKKSGSNKLVGGVYASLHAQGWIA